MLWLQRHGSKRRARYCGATREKRIEGEVEDGVGVRVASPIRSTLSGARDVPGGAVTYA